MYSTNPVKDEHIDVLDEFGKGITDHVAQAHCHVIMSFYQANLDMVLNQLLIENIGKGSLIFH